MFYSYQEKTTGSTSVKYFEVWNYYQEPNSALVASIAITNMFSSYDYADFPAFQIIPGVAN